jgi:hypothetical protein
MDSMPTVRRQTGKTKGTEKVAIRDSGQTFAEDRHPGQDEWILLLCRGLDPGVEARLAGHLSRCEACQALLAAIPRPPRRIFGRPMLAPAGKSVLEIEAEVDNLLRLLNGRTGPIAIAGTWDSEIFLNQLVARTVTRLERVGWSCEIKDAAREIQPVPIRPNVDLLVLLDAPWLENLQSWRQETAPGHIILTGELDVWKKVGIEPDVTLVDHARPRLIESFEKRFTEALSRIPQSARAALLANALCVDWPFALIKEDLVNFSGDVPLLAVDAAPGQPSGKMSVESPWIARHVLCNNPALVARVWSDASRIPIPYELRARLGLRAREWGWV